MIFRPYDIKSLGLKPFCDLAVQPVAARKAAHKHHMLGELMSDSPLRDKQLTENGLCASLRWSRTAPTMQETEGSKNSATVSLCTHESGRGAAGRRNIPGEFELPITDADLLFVVSRRPKFDELRFGRVSEAQLSGLVKAFHNGVQVVEERRFGEKV